MTFASDTSCADAFLRSALTLESPQSELGSIVGWVEELNRETPYGIERIPFNKLRAWNFDHGKGAIVHESGKFFSIEGYRVETTWGPVHTWDQPLINQAEVGYLGFIVKNFDGILHFLVQAKIEPGNSTIVQLSPTLQATRSNYMQVHRGRKPHYLEYFQSAKPSQVLLDQLQSEQGSRFLGKRNRNIIIEVDEPVEPLDGFRWMTLGQLKRLMSRDNTVNMDSRSVISGIHFGAAEERPGTGPGATEQSVAAGFLKSASKSTGHRHRFEEIISRMTHFKSTYDLRTERRSLDRLESWLVGDAEIAHVDGHYFRVIAVDVSIEGREVRSWTQPMVEPVSPGLCAFVCKEIAGLLHFAVQIKMECGNHDSFEFAPTVQSLDGGAALDDSPFDSYVRNARPEQIVFDAFQAEEGGRFFRDDNRNCVVLADDAFPEELPENFTWMTLHQIMCMMRMNNVFNIQARSLIAAVDFS